MTAHSFNLCFACARGKPINRCWWLMRASWAKRFVCESVCMSVCASLCDRLLSNQSFCILVCKLCARRAHNNKHLPEQQKESNSKTITAKCTHHHHQLPLQPQLQPTTVRITCAHLHSHARLHKTCVAVSKYINFDIYIYLYIYLYEATKCARWDKRGEIDCVNRGGGCKGANTQAAKRSSSWVVMLCRQLTDDLRHDSHMRTKDKIQLSTIDSHFGFRLIRSKPRKRIIFYNSHCWHLHAHRVHELYMCCRRRPWIDTLLSCVSLLRSLLPFGSNRTISLTHLAHTHTLSNTVCVENQPTNQHLDREKDFFNFCQFTKKAFSLSVNNIFTQTTRPTLVYVC